MKKLLCLILTLTLTAGAAVLPALAEEYADCACGEENFCTKVPRTCSPVYEEGNGLVIYTETKGYIPYVIVHRRTPDMKFNNPVNFLNNVFREYLEGKYGSVATSPAKTWEVGGKELTGARYSFKIGRYKVCQVQLIEIRAGGDVEYTAKYLDGEDAATMAALDAAVRYYGETDSAPADQPLPQGGDETADAPGPVLEPVSFAGTEADLQNGVYWAKIKDTARIEDGGYFTVELYESDQYAAADVENLKPGGRVRINGRIFTVRTLEPDGESVLRLTTEEASEDRLGFEKGEGDFYYAAVGSWHVSSFVTDTTIRMPLANAFVFAWADADDRVARYDADGFVSLLTGTAPRIREEDLTQDRTAVQFTDGLLTAVVHRDR